MNPVVQIDAHLSAFCREENQKREELSSRINSRECKKCGGTDFIQLFRNVVGEVDGRVCGHFSLFAGAVTGSITGSTRTLPVLSCVKCKNERKVDTWQYITEKEKFWDDMHDFYFHKEVCQLPQIYLDNPIGTRAYMLQNKKWDYDSYNDLPHWSTESWARAGFKIRPRERRFLFWEWEEWPKWEGLEGQLYR